MNAVPRYICGVCGGLVLLIGMQGHAEPPPAVSPSPPSQSTDMELIRTIIAHNTAARERIYSLPLRVELESETTYDHDPDRDAAPIKDPVPKGRRIDRTESVKIYDEPRFKTQVVKTYSVPEANYRRIQETSVIFNEEYMAEVFTYHDQKNVPFKSVHVFEHRANGEVLEETMKGVLGWKDPDIRKFGFAMGGSTTLQKLLDSRSNNIMWTVDDSIPNSTLLKLTYLGRANAQLRRAKGEFWLDSARDFLIVRADILAREGFDQKKLEVDLMELASGIWFPREVKINHRELNGRSYSQHIKVLRAEVLDRPPPEDFYVESFSFEPSRVLLYLHRPDGT